LFYIFYQTVASPEDAMEMLKLLQETSSFLKQKKKEEAFTDGDHFQVRALKTRLMLKIAYTVMLTLMCVLDVSHELVIPKTGEASHNLLLDNATFVQNFHQEVTRSWEARMFLLFSTIICLAFFQSIILLSWSLFLSSSSTVCNTCELGLHS
jgi:hypothetical protein